MSIITISSIFNNDYDDYKTYCNTVISDFITTTPYEDTLDLYIYLPVWLRYRDTPIKFSNDDKGKDAFLRNFNNQLSEVVFDFHNYAKENIEYFLYQNDTTKQGKPMSKTITSGIAPINQKIDQAVDSTNLASGTGSQFVSETVYNGIAWHKLVEGYFTPNRKTALLKSFQWLFVSVYSPETKYNDKIEEKRYVQLSFVDEDNNIIDEQKVLPTKSYYTMSEVNIQRPLMLDPQNIKKDVDIAGVVGTFEPQIYPRIYDVLRLDNPDGIIGYNTPSGYDGIEGVTITIPNTAIAENIKDGVNIGGIIGTYTGGVDYLKNHINADTDLYDYENNDVTHLNYYAFYYDRNIKSFKSNSAVSFANSHQGYMFWYCENLETVDMPNWEGSDFNSNGSNFQYCSNLKTVNLPKLKYIKTQDFQGCSSLLSVDFPEVGNYMGPSCFTNCTSLQTAKFGLNTVTLASNAFNTCTSLTDVYLPRTVVVTCGSTTFNNTTQLITIHVPSNLISSYQTATNWATLYNNGRVVFVAI